LLDYGDAVNDLDAFFGPRDDSPVRDMESINDAEEKWRKRCASDPAAWRRFANPITGRIAAGLQQDTGISLEGPGGKDLFRIAGTLLQEAGGDDVLLLQAIEQCRKNPRWRGLSPYVMKKEILFEANRQRAKAGKYQRMVQELLAFDYADEMVPCKRCGKMIAPEHQDLDCSWH
jgi:hypothetical protein